MRIGDAVGQRGIQDSDGFRYCNGARRLPYLDMSCHGARFRVEADRPSASDRPGFCEGNVP